MRRRITVSILFARDKKLLSVRTVLLGITVWRYMGLGFSRPYGCEYSFIAIAGFRNRCGRVYIRVANGTCIRRCINWICVAAICYVGLCAGVLAIRGRILCRSQLVPLALL